MSDSWEDEGVWLVSGEGSVVLASMIELRGARGEKGDEEDDGLRRALLPLGHPEPVRAESGCTPGALSFKLAAL